MNYFVFYIFKYKLHWTNAVKVPWPGYTKITEKEEKTHILCTFLIKLSVKVNCITRVQMYSHSTLLSRKMDSKPFNSLEAVKCGKSVMLKDWASCYIRKHLNCKCLNCGEPWVQAREYQPILCTLQGTPGWARETTKQWFCSSAQALPWQALGESRKHYMSSSWQNMQRCQSSSMALYAIFNPSENCPKTIYFCLFITRAKPKVSQQSTLF